MAADPPRDRRPAIWPYVVLPLVVLAVFCALERMHHRPGAPWTHAWDANQAPAGDGSPAAPQR
ncbi:MAG TPA: hypothetical protein VET46_02765 [Steroidobacteraceae bacterium]|nr:hypothetical protein [Steroidobacteraceae bacterium]